VNGGLMRKKLDGIANQSGATGSVETMNDQNPFRQPEHVAIIMDGNNRWARARGLRGVAGHRAGAEAAREIVYACIDRKIPYLTLFAFSSENWLRPVQEVNGLMALFLSVLRRNEIRQLHERNVRLQFIGNRASFPAKLQKNMTEVESLTCNNSGMVITVAADYGGQWDITQACRSIARQVSEGSLRVEDIDFGVVSSAVCLGDMPAPDLCIRTGGEHRISNFLLWQIAYTELYFTDTYWPDFNESSLQAALDDFSGRKRRYGRQSDRDEQEASISDNGAEEGAKIA
jgi:undecaprenyl diphosphate synthase